jgi:SPP1 family predicted phage head-tail adaptor
MPYNAGQLDQRITLRRRTAGVDALGQPSTTWANLVTVWAAARPQRGREFFAAGQQQAEGGVTFTIRHRADVQVTDQVLWRDQPHDIVSIADPAGRRETLELITVAGVRDGR